MQLYIYQILPRKQYETVCDLSLSPRMSDSLQAIFSGRAQIRREQLDLERQLKENALRQRHSEEANQQVHLFCAKEKTEKVVVCAAVHTFSDPRRKLPGCIR